MFIDTHCHLNFPQYDPDRAMVVGNAKKAGVKQFINPGVDLFSSKQAIVLAQKHPGVGFAAEPPIKPVTLGTSFTKCQVSSFMSISTST